MNHILSEISVHPVCLDPVPSYVLTLLFPKILISNTALK